MDKRKLLVVTKGCLEFLGGFLSLLGDLLGFLSLLGLLDDLLSLLGLLGFLGLLGDLLGFLGFLGLLDDLLGFLSFLGELQFHHLFDLDGGSLDELLWFALALGGL